MRFDRLAYLRRHALRFVVIVAMAAVFAYSSGADAAVDAGKGLFGSRETKSTSLKAFKKWNGMLQRFDNETMRPEWRDMIENLRTSDPMAQMEAIHGAMNRSPYITDPRNWGLKDYWETPEQFFRRNGDCEDYAIVKYLSLKALGFPPESMRIVVLKDMNLRLLHAVLAVYRDGEVYILDNQVGQVIKQERIQHYKPIFSINETAWWRHRT